MQRLQKLCRLLSGVLYIVFIGSGLTLMARPEEFQLSTNGITLVLLLIGAILINPATSPLFRRLQQNSKHTNERKDSIQTIFDSAKHIVLGHYCHTTSEEKSLLPRRGDFLPATTAIQLLYLKQWGLNQGLDPADVDREIRDGVKYAITTRDFRKSPLSEWTNLPDSGDPERLFQNLYVEPIEEIVSSELFDEKPEIAAAVIYEEDKMRRSANPPNEQELKNWSVRVYNYWLQQLAMKEGLTWNTT